MSDTSNQGAKFILDTTLKVLSALVIPLMIWGLRLEVTNAIQDERISEMQEDLDKLSNLTTSVQDQALALVRLEGKIDNVDTKIDEVKKLLNK